MNTYVLFSICCYCCRNRIQWDETKDWRSTAIAIAHAHNKINECRLCNPWCGVNGDLNRDQKCQNPIFKFQKSNVECSTKRKCLLLFLFGNANFIIRVVLVFVVFRADGFFSLWLLFDCSTWFLFFYDFREYFTTNATPAIAVAAAAAGVSPSSRAFQSDCYYCYCSA